MGISVPNITIGNFRPLAPQRYPQWRREIELLTGAQVGDTAKLVTSKLITTLPLAVKMDALSYMEAPEGAPGSRDMQRTPSLRGGQYGAN